jgi:divalent metal cation (Fe/Co/Zn/Cd) transporter
MSAMPYYWWESSGFMILFLILILWEIFWKGIALWKAARNDEKYWFIAILIINSLGIVPILYIYVFQKGKKGI